MRIFSIEEDRLLALLQAENDLNALTAAGVDNWDGCDYASEFKDLELVDAESVPDYCVDEGIELLEG